MKLRISDRTLREGQAPDSPIEIYDTVESGLVARLRPSGHISFWLYQNRGHDKRKIGNWPQYNTLRARVECRNIKHEDAEAEGPDSAIPFNEFISEIYTPAYARDHKNTKHLNNLVPFLKDWSSLELGDITEDLLDDWCSQRRRRVKAATVNRNVSALKAALGHAVRKGNLASNPIRGFRKLPVDQEFRVRWLSDEEEQRLRAALFQREDRLRLERTNANRWRAERDYPLLPDLSNFKFADHLRPMVLLSLNTGLRQGELFLLNWDHIIEGFLTVPATNAKSRRTRHIPLNREATDTLDHWGAQQESSGYVFKGKQGKLDNVRGAWVRLLRAAEIFDFTWHDMRHHFASRLVMKGVPLNTVRELLGHSDLKTTMRYAHLAPQHLRSAVELLDETY